MDYSRPFRRGRKIMGEVVPYDQVWRTGANDPTALTTDADLDVGGHTIPKGAYTLYTLPSKAGWKLIVNKNKRKGAAPGMTFTLMKPSGHVNYYGLVFGGSDLDGPKQSYLYFMVAQDGTWLIKRRDGDPTQDLAGRTSSPAVKKPDASGKSTNALEVRVMADKIDYLVNGTSVHMTPKAGTTAKTDGVYGIRVNHLLEVHIDSFGVAKL